MSYVGRFAPSPTGPLHLGSLVTAVASYLDARRAGGRWFVRIDDIDPPREVPGASAAILATLERLALDWDGPVQYQSTRTAAYREACGTLLAAGLAFACSCTRRELRELGREHGPYPGTCRTRGQHGRRTALRVRAEPSDACFEDLLQGRVGPPPLHVQGDYVVYRRDGLPAYHLASVLDDAAHGVTHVVRGADLLEPTHVHRHLQGVLGLPVPVYAHLPLVVDARGRKLSKGSGAASVDTLAPGAAAERALALLGLDVPAELEGAPPRELWPWAIARWRIETLAGQRVIRG